MSAADSTAWPYKPPCPHPGIPQGFLSFHTVAHRVLLALHQIGDLRMCDLVEELDEDPRHVSMALTRLRKWAFIYERRKVCGVPTHRRTQLLWTLEPNEAAAYRRLTGRERCRRYRERKRMSATSVFAFRGQISMEGRI